MQDSRINKNLGNEERVMKHYFVIGETGYSMSYSLQSGEWLIDKSDTYFFSLPFLQPIEIVEYHC